MKRIRKKYAVFVSSIGDGKVYAERGDTYFVGETIAVSEKQAINNVRYRNEGKTSNVWIVGDYLDDSVMNIHYYFAKEVNE